MFDSEATEWIVDIIALAILAMIIAANVIDKFHATAAN
jgi:hypothetical protein